MAILPMGIMLFTGAKAKLEMGFKKMNPIKCTFVLNFKTGTVSTTGTWADRTEKKSVEVQIKDHSNFTEVLEQKLKQVLGYDILELVLFELDFENRKSFASSFYIKGGKQLKDLKREISI